MKMQQTIDSIATCSGIGLHHGADVTIKLMPAPVDTGIVFVREFEERSIYIDAHVNNVFNTFLSTSVGVGAIHIHTVEHLMAACRGMEVDNMYVVLNSHEMPVMDGSARVFVNSIYKAGIRTQDRAKKYIKITDTIEISNNGQSLIIEPADSCVINYTINFPHPMINMQEFVFTPGVDDFATDIAHARTFCRFEDIENIKAMGLAKGGSLENSIVVDDSGILNKEGLRYKDEFVRHKVLDMVGDLSLLGMPLVGKITGVGSGHHLNVEFAKKILNSRDKWHVLSTSNTPAPQLTACI